MINYSDFKGNQAEAFEAIKLFIEEPVGGMFLLDGYAGTGKTYLVNYIIQYLLSISKHRYTIAVTAPTHKAVKVLRKQIKNKVDYYTTYSILGMTEFIDSYGKQKFIQKLENVKIHNYQFVIVDETSMVNDELFDILKNEINSGTKILFVGDSMQIPPVNCNDSVLFKKDIRKEYNIRYYKMNSIIRQEIGNPIIDLSFEIRSNIYRPIIFIDKIDRVNKKGSVKFIQTENLDEFLYSTIIPLYNTENFDNDPDYVKILAWRNKTVNKFNDIIRKSIYSDYDKHLPKLMINEKLITDEPVISEDNQIIIPTNEEITVIDYSIKEEIFVEGFPMIKYYDTIVRMYKENNDYIDLVIKILNEDSDEDYNEIMNVIKKYALSFKQGSFEARSAWIDYYQLKKRYCPVKYNYCVTCHKSQGSTYEHAVVINYDIDVNMNTHEKNRVLYTACTRPKYSLYIVDY